MAIDSINHVESEVCALAAPFRICRGHRLAEEYDPVSRQELYWSSLAGMRSSRSTTEVVLEPGSVGTLVPETGFRMLKSRPEFLKSYSWRGGVNVSGTYLDERKYQREHFGRHL